MLKIKAYCFIFDDKKHNKKPLVSNIEIVYSVWNIETGEFQELIGKKVVTELTGLRFFIDVQSGTMLVTSCNYVRRFGEASLYQLDERDPESSGSIQNKRKLDPIWTIRKDGEPEQYGLDKV